MRWKSQCFLLLVLNALGMGHGSALSVSAKVLQRPSFQLLKELETRGLLNSLNRDLEGSQRHLILDCVVGQHKRTNRHVAVTAICQNDLVEMSRYSNIGWVANDLVLHIKLVIDRVLMREVQGSCNDIHVLILFRQIAAKVFKMCPI